MKSECCGCLRCEHKLCTQKVPIFMGLDSGEIEKIAGQIKRREYAKGELILMEGSRLDSLVIINTGQVKAFRYNPEGKEQILYIFSEGDFFGERNLLLDKDSEYNIEALDTTKICMINKSDFRRLLCEYPDMGLKIMEELCRRLEQLENNIQGMGTGDIGSRLNGILLEFARKYGREVPEGIMIELPLSREGIANYIGVARETVSRKLSLLQDEGVIEMSGNKKIIILDKKALEQ